MAIRAPWTHLAGAWYKPGMLHATIVSRRVSTAAVAVTLALALVARARAADVQLDPFPMSTLEPLRGAAGASFLLDAPAGARGFVEVRDGRFTAGGKRIRFWGVNLCFSACFPRAEDAPRVAARLASLGVNCVRFHHMDSAPFPQGIFRDARLEDLSP